MKPLFRNLWKNIKNRCTRSRGEKEDGTVLYWNIKIEDQLPPKITEHTNELETISFMNGSSTLASADYSGITTLWDLETSQQITTHRTKTTFENTRYWLEAIPLAFSPDGTKLASKGILNTPTEPLGTTPQIRLIDVTTGRELTSLTYSNEDVTPNLTFSPDGKTVVFSAHSHTYGKIRLWNTKQIKFLISVSQINRHGSELPPSLRTVTNL